MGSHFEGTYAASRPTYRRMEYIHDISWGGPDASPTRSVRRPEYSERVSGNAATKRNPPYGLAMRSPRSDRRVTLKFVYLPFHAKPRSDQHNGCIRNSSINGANNAVNLTLIEPCPHPMSRWFLFFCPRPSSKVPTNLK